MPPWADSPGDGLHQTRHETLLDDLAGLDEVLWDVPSLCQGWTVHDVAAHLVDTARTTRLGFLAGLARARFDFHRQNARGVERNRGGSPQETLQRLGAVALRTSTPPAPLDSRLVEEVLHGEDVRRPLGLVRNYPQTAVVRALTVQARTAAAFGGARELIADLRLTATDADVFLGRGTEVRGPALSLLLAISGRSAGLAELEGPGLSALASATSSNAVSRPPE